MNDQQHAMRQVAILVASLDQTLAEQLLGKLTPAEAARARQAVADVGAIAHGEAVELIGQFRRARSEMPQQHSAEVALEGAPAAAPRPPATPQSGQGRGGEAAAEARFRFLSDADPHRLAPFLQRERPQTVALVLSWLRPEQAAPVLAMLPARTQVDVIQRLASLDAADEESVQAVARELETWLDLQHRNGQRQAAGLSAVSGILAAASPSERRVLVETLAALDQDLAGRVTGADGPAARRPTAEPPPPRPLALDDLARLDRPSLAAVLAAAEPELLVLALAGARGELLDHILAGLPKTAADTVRRDLAQLGPIRLSDVEAAQSELAGLAQSMQQPQETTWTSARAAIAA